MSETGAVAEAARENLVIGQAPPDNLETYNPPVSLGIVLRHHVAGIPRDRRLAIFS
jgi:hypothetical protein